MNDTDRELVLWASCIRDHPMPGSAAAVAAGGFDATSVASHDLLALERGGGSVRELGERMRAAGGPITILDAFATWYPGAAQGPDTASPDDLLRFADALGARSTTMNTPYAGTPAPVEAVAEALSAFAERAEGHGLALHLEQIPTSFVPDLPTAWEIVAAVDRPDVGLVLDTFHLARSGCTAEQLRALDPARVLHVQLCDGPVRPRLPDYYEEAVTHRDFAGEGELGILDIARVLEDMGALGHVGPEVFLAELGELSPAEAGRLCRARTDAFLAAVAAHPPTKGPPPWTAS